MSELEFEIKLFLGAHVYACLLFNNALLINDIQQLNTAITFLLQTSSSRSCFYVNVPTRENWCAKIRAIALIIILFSHVFNDGERTSSSIILAALAYCNISVIVRIVRGPHGMLMELFEDIVQFLESTQKPM